MERPKLRIKDVMILSFEEISGAKVLPSEAVSEGEKVWINLPWEEVKLFSREAQGPIKLNSGGE